MLGRGKLMAKIRGKECPFFAPLHKTDLHQEERNTALPYPGQGTGTLHRNLYQASMPSVFPSSA